MLIKNLFITSVQSLFLSLALMMAYILVLDTTVKAENASFNLNQEILMELSITAPPTVVMSNPIPGLTGGESTGWTGVIYPRTNNPAGYNITLAFSSTTAMQRVGGGGQINNYIPVNPSVPDYDFIPPTGSHAFAYTVAEYNVPPNGVMFFRRDFSRCNVSGFTSVGSYCWYNQVDATVPLPIIDVSQDYLQRILAKENGYENFSFAVFFKIVVAENPNPPLPEGIYQATATLVMLPN